MLPVSFPKGGRQGLMGHIGLKEFGELNVKCECILSFQASL